MIQYIVEMVNTNIRIDLETEKIVIGIDGRATVNAMKCRY